MMLRPPLLIASLAALLASGCVGDRKREVVVYTSVDQVFAEPLLAEFEQQTGVRARAVFDVEANKTVGLANRLAAERARPRADVFWNNEFLQTLRLKQSGVLAPSQPASAKALPGQWRDPDGVWYAVGARLRVLLVREGVTPPASLEELSRRPEMMKSFGMALPLFGTTATHLAALWSQWGPERTLGWLGRLQEGGARIADGNATVRDLVAQGRLDAGLTDSDDACHLPTGARATIHPLPPGEALLVPGTVAMVAGAPHPGPAQVLIDWLLRPETDLRLIQVGASQISLHDPARRAACLEGLDLRWSETPLDRIAATSEAAREALQARFRR